MNTKFLFLVLPAVAILAGCQGPGPTEPTARTTETAPTDLLNPNEPLYVVVNTDGISAVDEMSAYAYIKEAFEQVFLEEGEWQGELVFDRWPAGEESKQNQSIRLWLTQWEGRPLNEVVARFHISVHVPGQEKVDLGVVMGEAATLAATERQLIEQFQTAARRAFQQLYPQVLAMSGGERGETAAVETAAVETAAQ